MHTNNLTSFAVITVILAILAWSGVALFAYELSHLQDAIVAEREDHIQQTGDRSYLAQVQVLSSQTSLDRAVLERIINVDPVSLVNHIETLESQIGVSMQIANASPSPLPGKLPASAGEYTHAFTFDASAQGSFPSMMQALEILETLPAPSTVENFELQQTQAAQGGGKPAVLWTLRARVLVLTTSNV